MITAYCRKCGATKWVKTEKTTGSAIIAIRPCAKCGDADWSFKAPPHKPDVPRVVYWDDDKNITTNPGEKQEGVKFDVDKPRYDLLPADALEDVVHVLTGGAQKYADDNWKRVPNRRRRYYAAAWRHVQAWWRGESTDPEFGRNHLSHAICCLLFLLQLDIDRDPAVTNHKAPQP